ncbi:hypothetical protein IY145_00615 [Methylosinus sp. H3A]|uniref:hypothetical protein n=1 Tax=Methylosinus sp. H3A TaxID=2785786 RepID=UPI0018C2A9C9|nr:hypothetical protein [Methylosinus sp. H3A]MBG0807934.1 hypothetical protein [Methylosinus sp. H3A]
MKSLVKEFDFIEAWRHWHKAFKYADYSNYDSVINSDMAANIEKHKVATQPPLVARGSIDFESDLIWSDELVKLPVPFVYSHELLATISSILYAGFGGQKLASFHRDTVILKSVPSVGARHGIDAYVTFNQNEYYYNCVQHSLVHISGTTCNSGNERISISICFRPEIYMWRYESGQCLFDIYYDIGHVIGNMKLAAQMLNVEYVIFYSDGDDDSLISKVKICDFVMPI